MNKLVPTFTLGLLLALNMQAQAQDGERATQEQDTNRRLQTVVVNAQKKSQGEAAQDVPIALSAFNEESLQATLSDNFRDIGFYSPNTHLLENPTVPGTASFAIRGMGSTESTESVEASVGLVKDGIVYAQRYGSFIETFDIESLEVLRGPQGTLFGRNVTGGAVVVRSRRPKLNPGLSGQVRTVVGSDDRFDLMGYVDATIVPDKLGILVSAAGLSSNGTVANINPIGGTLGDKDVKNYRFAALYQPSDGFDATFIVEQNQNKSDTSLAIDPTYVTDFFTADRDLDKQIDTEATTYVLDTNLEVPGGILTTIAGYRETVAGDNGIQDLDGGPTESFGFRQELNHEQSSLEVRYATDGLFEKLDFTIGVFLMEQDLDLVTARFVGPPLAPINILQPSAAIQSTSSWAAFGQSDYYVSDTVTLTLGARYTHEEKDFNLAPRATGACNSAPLYGTDMLPQISDCAFSGEVSDSWNDFSPMARLSWKPSENLMTYVSASKGFRSGGFNNRATASGLDTNGQPIPYDDEVLTSYEAGFKSDIFDRRLRLNGAVFFNEVEGLQRSVTGPPPALAQSIFNAGAADISGIELDMTWVAFEDNLVAGDSLVFSGNYGFVDADYTFFDTDGDGVSDSDQLEFNKVSPHTYAVSLFYDAPLGELGDIGARLAYRFEDETYPDTDNARAKLPKVQELDASLSFDNADGWLTLKAFVKNLTDEESLYQVLPVINEAYYPRPGRRFGVEAIVRF